jgi:predicted Fe-Mo cluster-binding NifX family protein
MKVAIGMRGPGLLQQGHFGESPAFLVVELGGVAPAPREWRPNPWHAEPLATRPPKIAAQLADCDAILVRSIAHEGLMELSRRFAVLLAPREQVEDLIATLEREGVAAFRRFDREAGKFQ